jgi:hypothetical protein
MVDINRRSFSLDRPIRALQQISKSRRLGRSEIERIAGELAQSNPLFLRNSIYPARGGGQASKSAKLPIVQLYPLTNEERDVAAPGFQNRPWCYPFAAMIGFSTPPPTKDTATSASCSGVRLALLALLLSGCVTRNWVTPPGMSESEAHRADSECQGEAEQGSLYTPTRISDYQNCMQRRGFTKEKR